MKLAVSVGCPSGIGPEVSALAAARFRHGNVLLVGDVHAILRAVKHRRLAKRLFEVVDTPRFVAHRVAIWQPTKTLKARDRDLGKPTPSGGAAQLAWIDAACDLVTSGEADAMVTGPVSKEVIARSRAHGAANFLGHTEHLQRRLQAREVVMAFVGDTLTTALVTTHLPLSEVPRAITAPSVGRATFWLAHLLAALGERKPRIAVAALNPHAGEGGRLGRDEARIARGIALARRRAAHAGIRATIVGAIPAETAFRLAARGECDGVVAMYHDQATIPMKLLDFGDAVNVSLGLPIVRTSVDHGTGYDRAAHFNADPSGMRAALELAARLVTATPKTT